MARQYKYSASDARILRKNIQEMANERRGREEANKTPQQREFERKSKRIEELEFSIPYTLDMIKNMKSSGYDSQTIKKLDDNVNLWKKELAQLKGTSRGTGNTSTSNT